MAHLLVGRAPALTVGQETGQGRHTGGVTDEHDDIGVVVRPPHDGEQRVGGRVVDLPVEVDIGLAAPTVPDPFGGLPRSLGGGAQHLINAEGVLAQPAAGRLRLRVAGLGQLALVVTLRAGRDRLRMPQQDEGPVHGRRGHTPSMLQSSVKHSGGRQEACLLSRPVVGLA